MQSNSLQCRPQLENQNAASRLHHLMQLLPAGVLVLDEHGDVAEANSQAAVLLGEPLLGQPWRDVIAREFAPRADDGHEISLRNGRRVSLATRALDPESGQLVMLTDLTETRELQRSVSHLERLSALGKMAASLAHQIRTPLSAALLYAANLSSPNLDQPGHKRFQQKLMDRLGELEKRVNDLLLFARGGHTQEIRPVGVEQLGDTFSSSCEAMLASHSAQLSMQIPPNLVVNANADALVGALQNLANNALDAGAKLLRLEVVEQDQWLQLRFMDNGKGMSAQELNQAGTPFYTTKANGTGLGLAVVQTICRSHGGRLELQSVPGQGSCFTLALPKVSQGPRHGEQQKELEHE